MDNRHEFIKRHILDKNKNILEIGPLNRPLVSHEQYLNAVTADIRSTQEIKELYCGNDYLKATGITIYPETIVDVDFVLKNTYRETFGGHQKFDYFIASHVIEHVEDIIFFFQDIATVLNPNGKVLIVYPDKRYCFDHFRESASFRDAYDVYKRGRKETARMVLDFFTTVIPENSPLIYWQNTDVNALMLRDNPEHAIKYYEETLAGRKQDDVHFWPFSEYAFLKFIFDLTKAGLFSYRCIDFIPCTENDQQFMVALEYDPSVINNPEDALNALTEWLRQAHRDYMCAEDFKVRKELKMIQESFANIHNELQNTQANLIATQNELENKQQEFSDTLKITHEVLKAIQDAMKITHRQLNSSQDELQSEKQNNEVKQQKLDGLEQILQKERKKYKDLEEMLCNVKAELAKTQNEMNFAEKLLIVKQDELEKQNICSNLDKIL